MHGLQAYLGNTCGIARCLLLLLLLCQLLHQLLHSGDVVGVKVPGLCRVDGHTHLAGLGVHTERGLHPCMEVTTPTAEVRAANQACICQSALVGGGMSASVIN